MSDVKYSKEGTLVNVKVRDKIYNAKICKLPFYKKNHFKAGNKK